MNETIMFLTFCLTIVALVSLGRTDVTLAQSALDHLGEMGRRLVSPWGRLLQRVMEHRRDS